ncbi:MAG: Nif3-like dinuclear metal center hexameric protein [Faecalibacterium sp.]|jgi:dinuclear metal center YbgI/SA1388 family protein|nr:Nif3-like dinuclear metal center hexameric protein [Faecalibacterium sp.]
MATVAEIYAFMARLAPPELAASWDNPGLLVDTGAEVSGILTTLDITAAVVAEAARTGCQLIVSHHPVIFDPLKRLGPQDVAFALVQNGISAICMHTNLDAAPGGVNEVLAGLFAMQTPVPFAEGCGRVGTIAETDTRALSEKAQAVLHTAVKFADAGKPIRRLAVISGAGGSMFADALAVGADCLLTGEASHHAALDATRLGLSLIAAGHYATEWPIVPVLAEKLAAAFPKIRVSPSTCCQAPFTYL